MTAAIVKIKVKEIIVVRIVVVVAEVKEIAKKGRRKQKISVI